MATTEPDHKGRRAGRWLALVAILACITAALIVFAPWTLLPSDEDEAATGFADRATGTVTLATLSESYEAVGTLSPTPTRTIIHPGNGIVTTNAAPGQAVANGQVLYSVDEAPTVVVSGEVPAWRTMRVDDEGPDVHQLEQALVDLGYDAEGQLTVDSVYTSYTADLVELWQEDVGLTVTGSVEFGTLVFFPFDADGSDETASVAEQLAVAGATVQGSEVSSLTGSVWEVRFSVDVAELATVADRTEVTVTPPSGGAFAAKVVGSTPLGAGQWEITAALEDDAVAGLTARSAVPVEIEWTSTLAVDTLAVPAKALTRLDDGTYAVELLDGAAENGRTRLVPVQPLASAGRLVAISADLNPGQAIISP